MGKRVIPVQHVKQKPMDIGDQQAIMNQIANMQITREPCLFCARKTRSCGVLNHNMKVVFYRICTRCCGKRGEGNDPKRVLARLLHLQALKGEQASTGEPRT